MKITRRYEERINELFISHESLFIGHQYESFQDDGWHFLVDEHKITLKTSFSCSTKNLFNFLSTRLVGTDTPWNIFERLSMEMYQRAV